MKKKAEEYFGHLASAMRSIQFSNAIGASLDFFTGLGEVAGLITSQSETGKKLIFIGNGASASISSHMSTDYWKNGRIRAISFNDSSLLTCISNDYGYQHVFEKPIEMFADSGDILFAISSSGKSENILNGVLEAKEKNCHVITLSGFLDKNPLRCLGDYNFYVPSLEYGPVEILHVSICHCILDVIIANRKLST